MKVAKLVLVEFLVRVIVDENYTDDQLTEKIKVKVLDKVNNNEIFENLTEVKDDEEVPYQIGEEFEVAIGDDFSMPDANSDDTWQYGDWIGRVVNIYEHEGVIYATLEDGDSDCFDIEAYRLVGRKEN